MSVLHDTDLGSRESGDEEAASMARQLRETCHVMEKNPGVLDWRGHIHRFSKRGTHPPLSTLRLVQGGVILCWEADFPATPNTDLGAERCFDGLCETDFKEIGNPDDRIPENVPGRGRAEEEGKTAGAGNPDIRVPERLKIEEGLRAACAERAEDAEGAGPGHRKEEENGGERVTHDPHLGEKQPSTGRDDPSEGQESPKKPEFYHVPGGTWLKQEIGNPDDRIPENVPGRGRAEEEGKTGGAGNPDIRVPERLKIEEGLRAARGERAEDAEGAGVGQRKEENGGERVTHDPHLGEKQPSTGRDDPSEGQESPKKPEFHHVPGGTWLKQVWAYLGPLQVPSLITDAFNFYSPFIIEDYFFPTP
ncbi:hypothetical protein NDU88_006343 [Pleurodeles waltl]|uniref:Uncharacterized protein n=1 Tax=Pleurodeles waltl TaxID=8319 RepID=A0AAV7WDB2_PLEWA|nr:hypothetical protein NDU88_006343 [Pleurodeles waltl]